MDELNIYIYLRISIHSTTRSRDAIENLDVGRSCDTTANRDISRSGGASVTRSVDRAGNTMANHANRSRGTLASRNTSRRSGAGPLEPPVQIAYASSTTGSVRPLLGNRWSVLYRFRAGEQYETGVRACCLQSEGPSVIEYSCVRPSLDNVMAAIGVAAPTEPVSVDYSGFVRLRSRSDYCSN